MKRFFQYLKKDNLCYIHGTTSIGDSIVVGHGDINKSVGSNLDNDDDYMKEAEAALYKNTEQIFKNHQAFFNNVKKIFINVKTTKYMFMAGIVAIQINTI